jgi:CheY-like chemotaxis protein
MGFEKILGFFDNQSALANLIQICSFAGAVILAMFKIPKWIKSIFPETKFSTLRAWFSDCSKVVMSAKTMRVLILDDEPVHYPIVQLCRMGYRVEEKTTISLSEIDSLRVFDVILLDIRGVLKEDLRTGGLEILKKLKSEKKSPYVIAVSSKGFDPTVAEFFMLANERLKKPIPQADIEIAIQRAFASSFSPLDAAKRIDELLGTDNLKNSTARKNLKCIQSFLSGEMDEEKLQLQLSKTLGTDVVKRIASDLQIVARGLK